jgi:hypothetical protein
MDTEHFDRATKILSTAGTRRGLVHLVAAVPVLGVLLAANAEEANAERPHERMHRRTQQRNRKQRNQRRRNTSQNQNNSDKNDGGDGGSCCNLGEPTPCASVLKSAGCQINTFPEQRWECPSGANLEEAQLFGCDLTSALLEGTNLRRALLREAVLRGAFLTGADLTGANLSEAKLQGAFMDNADLSGVIWDGTTCPDGTNSDDHGLTCCGHLNGTPRAGC